ncbi:MAG: hypothetical protein GY811_01680 [Myxococcales bacterium]|nr:hypothetical protein [Myxococcales bacterium]
MLFEDYSALLLVGHAVGALLCVALSTHLLVWLRRWSRGTVRHGSIRRFAVWSAVAYATTMLLGMALYPTYKVRVRAEYLENPTAISRATEENAEAARRAMARNQESRRFRSGISGSAKPLPPLDVDQRQTIEIRADRKITRAAKLMRWFDVKEHWSALGLILAGALLLLLWVAPSEKPQRGIARSTLALALASAAIAWSAAIIGVLVTAARSVAGI